MPHWHHRHAQLTCEGRVTRVTCGQKCFFSKLFLDHLGCCNKWFEDTFSHISRCKFPKSYVMTKSGGGGGVFLRNVKSWGLATSKKRGVYPFCAQLKFSKTRHGGITLDGHKCVSVHFWAHAEGNLGVLCLKSDGPLHA